MYGVVGTEWQAGYGVVVYGVVCVRSDQNSVVWSRIPYWAKMNVREIIDQSITIDTIRRGNRAQYHLLFISLTIRFIYICINT